MQVKIKAVEGVFNHPKFAETFVDAIEDAIFATFNGKHQDHSLKIDLTTELMPTELRRSIKEKGVKKKTVQCNLAISIRHKERIVANRDRSVIDERISKICVALAWGILQTSVHHPKCWSKHHGTDTPGEWFGETDYATAQKVTRRIVLFVTRLQSEVIDTKQFSKLCSWAFKKANWN